MTRSKSWARRRAVQVLRIANGDQPWMVGSMARDVEPHILAHQFGWALWGVNLAHGDPVNSTTDRASNALLRIAGMAGATTEVRGA